MRDRRGAWNRLLILRFITVLAITGTVALPPALAQRQEHPPRAVTAAEKARARFHDSGHERDAKLTPGAGYSYRGDTGTPAPSDLPPYLPYIEAHTCSAQLIVVATNSSKRSLLNDSETSIFTDYVFDVNEVLLRAPGLPPKNTVLVTVDGGTVIWEGRPTTVTYSGPTIRQNGQYVLFLRALPGGDGYVLMSPLGLVERQGENARSLGPLNATPLELLNDSLPFASFLSDIRDAAANCHGESR